MEIFGIDASLTGTGVALPDGSTARIDPKTKRGTERLVFVRDQVKSLLQLEDGKDPYEAHFVTLEGYSYASANGAHQIGELGGVLRVMLYEMGVEFREVAPTQVKKWAHGKGNGDKSVISSAVSAALGRSFASNDEVDAFILRDIGVVLHGGDSIFGMTQYRRDVIHAIQNPKPKGRKK